MSIWRWAIFGAFSLGALCSGQDKELRELADSLTSQVKSRGKGPVAITSFGDGSYCPAFSTYLVDRLSILMARGNTAFDVITRDRVEEVFKEINLSLGKNYDASTFAKIGKQLGTKSLIRGHYTVQAAAATVSLAAQILRRRNRAHHRRRFCRNPLYRRYQEYAGTSSMHRGRGFGGTCEKRRYGRANCHCASSTRDIQRSRD